MSRTEYDIIEDIFFDAEGLLKAPIADSIDKVSFIAQQYKDDKGVVYLRNLRGEELEGITDTEGHYIYIRYQDGPRVEGKTIKVPLRAVLIFEGAMNIEEITMNLWAFMKNGAKGVVGNTATIEYNRQLIFAQETGLDIKELKTDLAISAIDFNVLLRLPINCQFPEKKTT